MHNDKYIPKQKRSEQTLAKIIDAMMYLLEEKCFEQITIKEIVEGDQVSAGTFYRRFENKGDCLVTSLFPIPTAAARMD